MENASGVSTSTTRIYAESGKLAPNRTEITLAAAMPFSPEERSRSRMVVWRPPTGPDIGVDSTGPNDPPFPFPLSLRDAVVGNRTQFALNCTLPERNDTLESKSWPVVALTAFTLRVAGSTAALQFCNRSSSSSRRKQSGMNREGIGVIVVQDRLMLDFFFFNFNFFNFFFFFFFSQT